MQYQIEKDQENQKESDFEIEKDVPETYTVLIDQINDNRLSIREITPIILNQLVPYTTYKFALIHLQKLQLSRSCEQYLSPVIKKIRTMQISQKHKLTDKIIHEERKTINDLIASFPIKACSIACFSEALVLFYLIDIHRLHAINYDKKNEMQKKAEEEAWNRNKIQRICKLLGTSLIISFFIGLIMFAVDYSIITSIVMKAINEMENSINMMTISAQHMDKNISLIAISAQHMDKNISLITTAVEKDSYILQLFSQNVTTTITQDSYILQLIAQNVSSVNKGLAKMGL